ncbi:uracil-DNA glycosylase family protein [Novosphingobium kunmingense]|uniref:hypothetical protein n=1 Tax=Novosphingobium kunmingense TaxID=1211806 RepID=UPI001E54DF5C|nr:hypothetical protein [Novosphingobium kunmingense]
MHPASQNSNSSNLPAGAIAAALDWWRLAGVDCHFADEATAWLAEPEAAVPEPVAPAAIAPRAAASQAPPRARFGGASENWPQSLDAFAAWWLGEPTLDDGRVEGRVAPRGPAGAKLMVLVDQPEPEDAELLLSGPQGGLLQGVLRALGLRDDHVYLASALPRSMPMPDWAMLAADGLGSIVAHHVALASPQRILVLGGNVSSLLGHDPAKRDGFLPFSGHDNRRIPALVAPGLAALATRARGKARLWQTLLDWTGADWMGTN